MVTDTTMVNNRMGCGEAWSMFPCFLLGNVNCRESTVNLEKKELLKPSLIPRCRLQTTSATLYTEDPGNYPRS